MDRKVNIVDNFVPFILQNYEQISLNSCFVVIIFLLIARLIKQAVLLLMGNSRVLLVVADEDSSLLNKNIP